MFHQCWRDIHTTSTSNNPQRCWPPPVFTPVILHQWKPWISTTIPPYSFFSLVERMIREDGNCRFWWCASRYMWIVVNSVCQREKALVGICSPKQTKPLASNCRCACARQLWRSRRGSRKARQFCLFAGTANLVVIVTTGMQVCRKQTGTRRIFLPH